MSAITNNSEGAQWIYPRGLKSSAVLHPEVGIASSWIGYLLFGLIIYACFKNRVFWKRRNDVLLILFFAFVSDFFRMRLNIFFMLNEGDNGWRTKDLPTTVAACTMSVWIFYAHFLITYIDASVSVYRFTTRFIGKTVSLSYMYAGIGVIFTLLAALFFESFFQGASEPVFEKKSGYFAYMYCTKAYTLHDFVEVAMVATGITMAIAPILSFLMLFKTSKKHERESGVTTFTFLWSFSLAFFVYYYYAIAHMDLLRRIPDQYEEYAKLAMAVAFSIQDFRFPLMCLGAIMFVGDIRGAVFYLLCCTKRKQKRELERICISDEEADIE